MRHSVVLLFALSVAVAVSGVQGQVAVGQTQPCPGKCGSDWTPVCGLNSKGASRLFPNVCQLFDWNRCNKGDYQVSKFGSC